MGICTTSGDRITKSLRYGDGYWVLSDDLLQAYHLHLQTKLRAADGGRALIVEMFGDAMVEHMVSHRQLRVNADAVPLPPTLDVDVPMCARRPSSGSDDESIVPAARRPRLG